MTACEPLIAISLSFIDKVGGRCAGCANQLSLSAKFGGIEGEATGSVGALGQATGGRGKVRMRQLLQTLSLFEANQTEERKTMKKRAAVLLMLGLMPWTGLYAQQTTETTFKVSAKVQAVCEVTASDLDFGVYTSKAPTVEATTRLSATCTPGSTYSVGLNEGTSPGATVNQRKMVSGSNALNYQLYSDSARSTIWGDKAGKSSVTGVGNGSAQDHTVFGSIPAAQTIPAGDYGDVITVRVYY